MRNGLALVNWLLVIAFLGGCVARNNFVDDRTSAPGERFPEGRTPLEDGREGDDDPTKKPTKKKPKKDDDDADDPDEDEGEDGDDEEEDEGPRTSNGSGGEAGQHTIRFAASNGERSEYKINVPEDAIEDKVYGLHIHLHGDGGGGYRDYPNRQAAHDLIGVTVKAPNPNLQWGRREGVAHGVYLHELIQNDLLKKYNIDLDRIYFSTVSGGSYFLTGNFIPTYGHIYRSGALVLCGGERPRVEFKNPEFLLDFRIVWQSTNRERRDIQTSIDASVQRYRAALDAQIAESDTDVDAKTIQESGFEGAGGHCEFDGFGYTRGIQSIIDRKFDVVLTKDD